MPWLDGALDPGTMLAVATAPATDTLYADVSEWQRRVDNSYPYRVIAIRSNDGTYRDRNWARNYSWCKRYSDENALVFFIVYFVWRQNWQQTVDTLKDLVGQPHPRMAVMIDVESWQGQITGNQSDGLNKAYRAIADWLGDRRRVGPGAPAPRARLGHRLSQFGEFVGPVRGMATLHGGEFVEDIAPLSRCRFCQPGIQVGAAPLGG